jgi:hypothetical protein
MEIRETSWKKYLLVLCITLAVFLTGFLASNYLNNQKIENIQDTENQISLDILSSEAQYQLLEQSSCSIVNGSILSDQLNTLDDKLSYAESQEGFNSADVKSLKENYSLLEIKDYLLMQEIYQKCGATPTSILYFYSNKGDCPDCTNQGYILTELRQQYPDLRVYSFDYNLGLSAIDTLVSVYHIPSVLPALVMNGKVYDGLQSVDNIKASLPSLALDASSTASTSNGVSSPAPASSTSSSVSQTNK